MKNDIDFCKVFNINRINIFAKFGKMAVVSKKSTLIPLKTPTGCGSIEKMKKRKIIYIIYNARSVIRAAVCVSLDLYGFIILVNC